MLATPVTDPRPDPRCELRDRDPRHDRVPRCTAQLWGIAFAGFPYAIALKTGNPAAVNSSFILFFPFAFLTTTFLPKEALTGWLSTVATYNPVTYVLDGLRSLILEGWEWEALAKGLGATLALTVVSFGLASAALRGRIKST